MSSLPDARGGVYNGDPLRSPDDDSPSIGQPGGEDPAYPRVISPGTGVNCCVAMEYTVSPMTGRPVRPTMRWPSGDQLAGAKGEGGLGIFAGAETAALACSRLDDVPLGGEAKCHSQAIG